MEGKENEKSVIQDDLEVNGVNPVFCLMSYCTSFWRGS
jgi:hypothetical protein